MPPKSGGRAVAKSSLLFAGPIIAEFGHELMAAGVLRALSRRHGRTVICTRAGRQALYADFADETILHQIRCEGMMMMATADTKPSADVLRQFVPRGVQPYRLREYYGRAPAEFIRYGTARDEWRGALVIHARNRDYVASRNWPARLWHRLARHVRSNRLAERIICIGTRGAAHGVEGALDMRDATLQTQMDVLASARLAVGPSSGPMHLASLCGCPHVVWCGGGRAEVERTMSNYRKWWNPHGTPCDAFARSSWRPSFGEVWSHLVAGLQALKRREAG